MTEPEPFASARESLEHSQDTLRLAKRNVWLAVLLVALAVPPLLTDGWAVHLPYLAVAAWLLRNYLVVARRQREWRRRQPPSQPLGDGYVTDPLPRLTDGPPLVEAHNLAPVFASGERFVVVRRGGGLMRYDATEWEAWPERFPGVPAAMLRVGFGLTRWGAMRSLSRSPRTRW